MDDLQAAAHKCLRGGQTQFHITHLANESSIDGICGIFKSQTV